MPVRIYNSSAFLLAMLLFALLALAGCGGGGGGGGVSNVTVLGRVLRAETGTAPNPVATVNLGGTSVQTDADGDFTIVNAPTGDNTLTIAASGSQTLTQTVTVAATPNATTNLGTLYLSNEGYTAIVTGRIVSQGGSQFTPVANATITLAGRSVNTGADGTFRIDALPVGLGSTTGQVVGSITATGFENRSITAELLRVPLEASNPANTSTFNALGDIPITAPAGTTPAPPFTITGRVTVAGQTPGAAQPVQVFINRTGQPVTEPVTTVDANGNYFFWVTPGDYTITAQLANGTASGTTTVTLQNTGAAATAPVINLTP